MASRHAIIIDDQPINIDVLALLLAREDVAVTAVDSPAQVMTIINQAEQIDVIFLDLEMPSISYYYLLLELKALPRLSSVPIIAYTVHTSEIESARAAGFDGFLGKPLQISVFPEQLRRILNGEAVWAGQYGEVLG